MSDRWPVSSFLSVAVFVACLQAGIPFPATAGNQETMVTVSWNTWETNFDENGRPGNLTHRGYYTDKFYYEGAPEASFDEPYDVAADQDIFPEGTMLFVGSGIGWVRVVDICGACEGRVMIDVWCGKNEYMHHKDNISTDAGVLPKALINASFLKNISVH